MNGAIRNFAVTILAGLLIAGCGTTRTQMAGANDGTIVFGKFRLLRNGEEVSFGDGIFANSAMLNLYEAGSERQIVASVGRDGEFSWNLAPGEYRLSSIAFMFHGERFEPQTNFVFSVSSQHAASYVGTVTLESTFQSGYLGLNGAVDRITIVDDCHSDCASRLARLGLEGETAATSLPRWQRQVASTN